MSKAASTIKNTLVYEASVTGRVVLEHLRQLRKSAEERALLGQQAPSPAVAAALGQSSAQLAARCRFDGLVAGVGDVVMFGGGAGVVRACAQTGDEMFLLLERMAKRSDARGCSVWALEPQAATVVRHVFFEPRKLNKICPWFSPNKKQRLACGRCRWLEAARVWRTAGRSGRLAPSWCCTPRCDGPGRRAEGYERRSALALEKSALQELSGQLSGQLSERLSAATNNLAGPAKLAAKYTYISKLTDTSKVYVVYKACVDV